MNKIEFANAFLAARGMDLAQLAQVVRPLKSNETMLLAGSIAYGLANKESDIDLLLLSSDPVDSRGNVVVRYKEFDAWNVRVAEQDVNVELFRFEDVASLADRHAQMIALFDEPAGVKRLDSFSDGELQLLSRLRDGIVVANETGAQYWRERARLDSLPLYLIVKNIADHLVVREDMIGQYDIGEYESALGMAMQAVVDVTAAVLASFDITCVKDKWQLRLLRRHEEQIGTDTVEAILAARFPDRRQAKREVEQTIVLADRLISQICRRRPDVAEMLATINNKFKLTGKIGGKPPPTN